MLPLLGCTAVTVSAALTTGAAPLVFAASLLSLAAGLPASAVFVFAAASALSDLPEQAATPKAIAIAATTASSLGCEVWMLFILVTFYEVMTLIVCIFDAIYDLPWLHGFAIC
jgi:hypothetical protein